jgi:hypothetical protein
MRKLIFGFIIIALSLMFLGGDVYNQEWTSIIDDKGALSGYITFPARTDSTGSDHSNPLYIAGFNDADAYMQAVAATASDKNIILHFSNNLQNWTARTMTGFDATSNTMKIDTLGDAGCPEWHSYAWMVVEDDGQAAATSDDILEVLIQAHADKANSETVEAGSQRTDP